MNLYTLGQELLKAKQIHFANFHGDNDKLDRDLSEEDILEMEDYYIAQCKLYNDYDENDPVLNWRN